MLESVQDRRVTSTEVFQTVALPETADIFLKAAAQTGTDIALAEIRAQSSESIDGKPEPEDKSGQEEVVVKVIWETKEQEQDFWVAFDIEWRKANNP
jgi:hypothetical protein